MDKKSTDKAQHKADNVFGRYLPYWVDMHPDDVESAAAEHALATTEARFSTTQMESIRMLCVVQKHCCYDYYC